MTWSRLYFLLRYHLGISAKEANWEYTALQIKQHIDGLVWIKSLESDGNISHETFQPGDNKNIPRTAEQMKAMAKQIDPSVSYPDNDDIDAYRKWLNKQKEGK